MPLVCLALDLLAKYDRYFEPWRESQNINNQLDTLTNTLHEKPTLIKYFTPQTKIVLKAYETTFKDFDFYMTSIGEDIVRKKYRHRKHSQPSYPAKWLTWDQAHNYCLWLGSNIGYSMNLLTEAQWEYAARSRGKAVAHTTNNGDIEYGVNYRDPRKIVTIQIP